MTCDHKASTEAPRVKISISSLLRFQGSENKQQALSIARSWWETGENVTAAKKYPELYKNGTNHLVFPFLLFQSK